VPAGSAPSVAELHQQARTLEDRRDWLEACRAYEDILRRDRSEARAREGYQRCLRRFHLVRRHRDPVYLQAASRLTAQQAFEVYEQVLQAVAAAYVDPRKTSLSVLFREGLRELGFALDEEAFRQEHLPTVSAEVLAALRGRLDTWDSPLVTSRSEARKQVLAVIAAAQQAGLAFRPALVTVFILEFAAGACNALDEYTLFLTPGSFDPAHVARPRLVSVGIEVAPSEEKEPMAQQATGLLITRVYPRSPARDAGLLPGDRLLSIDGAPVGHLQPEAVAERLRGPAREPVKLVVIRPGDMMSRTVPLVRAPIVVPSVDSDLQTLYVAMGEPGSPPEPVAIGRIRIHSFQEETVQEVKEALASLQTAGIRGLVLDLRGNPGGLFKPAVAVTELFIGEGVLVITQSQAPLAQPTSRLPHLRDYNRPYKAAGGNPVQLPLVVLIDGDTASSAEVLAGALKELRRDTRLVGQTTFGKGSIQCIIPLEKSPLERMPGGIRITVARILSPSRHPYSGHGITPDIVVSFDGDPDPVPAEARRQLQSLLKIMPPMPMEMPQ
jgi:carboxyl-terminal processing protease